MRTLCIIVLACLLLLGLLHFERREKRKGVLLSKTPLSLLFILAILIQTHPIPGLYHFLLVGLLFCFIGDVCLAFAHEKVFLLGLVSFLLGHLFYILGFFHASEIGEWTWLGSIIVIPISGGIYLWLRPHLGSMNVPVFAYVVVITVMVSGAWTILGDSRLALSGRTMLFAGAMGFYVSDLFVARDRFMKKAFINRLIGLPMYYAGQFLLAFSVGSLHRVP
jgi:uncharacterized membrane protein YhhN